MLPLLPDICDKMRSMAMPSHEAQPKSASGSCGGRRKSGAGAAKDKERGFCFVANGFFVAVAKGDLWQQRCAYVGAADDAAHDKADLHETGAIFLRGGGGCKG